jgi:hypothetical protein
VRFYVKLVIAIAIIALVFLWLQLESEKSPTPAATSTPAAAGSPTPPVNVPAQGVSGTPVPYVPAATPYVAPRPTPDPYRGLVMGIAQQARVQVTSYSERDGWVVVTVRARERNGLNDFLDAAQRQGLKDIDMNVQDYKVITNKQLQQTHQKTFRMRF